MKKIVVFILLGIIVSVYGVYAQSPNCKQITYDADNGLYDNYVNDFAMNDHGTIALKHYEGLSLFKNGGWSKKMITGGQFSYGAFAIDNNDVFYFGTYGLGLAQLKDTIWTYFDTTHGLPEMFVENLTFGHNNEIWMVYSDLALVKYDGTNFVIYDTNDLDNLNIYHVVKGKNGKMFFGNWEGLVYMYDGTAFTQLPLLSGDMEITELLVDHEGMLWALTVDYISSKHQLYKFDGVAWNQVVIDFLEYSNYPHIAFDNQGFMWMADYDGLIKNTKIGYRNYFIYNIDRFFLDKNNNVWFTIMEGTAGITVLEESGEISGRIFADDSCTDAYVLLYSKIENSNRMKVADSVVVDANGNYVFEKVSLGSYLVYAVPNKTSYPDYIGTYYKNTELWQSATMIDVFFCDSINSRVDISLVYVEPSLPGNGYISGHVKSLDGTRASAEPIKDVDVTLRKVPGGVTKQAKTDDNGRYEFTDLPAGTYGVFIDIPGLTLDSVRTVVITEADTIFEDQDYGVDSSGVKVDDFSSLKKNNHITSIKIGPNPTYGKLSVFIPASVSGLVELNIINLQGQLIMNQTVNANGTGNEMLDLDLDGYPKGIYFIQLKNNSSSRFEKLLLQ